MGSVLVVLFGLVLAWAMRDAFRETRARRARKRGAAREDPPCPSADVTPVPPVRTRAASVEAPRDDRPILAIAKHLTDAEARRLLDALPPLGTGNMTLAERIVEHFHGLLRDAERTAGVDHCHKGPACHGVTHDVCACPCDPCDLRRTLLTQTQRLFRLPRAVRMPGETRDAWALRSGERSLAAARLFEALRRAVEAEGLPVEHCNGRACKARGGCACLCDPCARVRSLLAQAERVTPPVQSRPPAQDFRTPP